MKGSIALGALLVLSAASSANLLQNGGFQDTTFTSPYQILTGSQLNGWQIVGGNVAGIAAGYLGAPTQEIDLSGTVDQGPPPVSGISQTVSTVAGKTYYVSFQVYAGQSNTGYAGGVDFRVNNAAVATNLTGNRSTFNYSFVGTGSPTTLSFLSETGNVSHIDNVTLATPGPGAVLAFGLSAAGARLRRRRAR